MQLWSGRVLRSCWNRWRGGRRSPAVMLGGDTADHLGDEVVVGGVVTTVGVGQNNSHKAFAAAAALIIGRLGTAELTSRPSSRGSVLKPATPT